MRVKLSDIRVGKRHRALRQDNVDSLMESIEEIGLREPISVMAVPARREGGADTVVFELVAGLHRLEACRALGWTEIEVSVGQYSADERELWELDENLMRAELTELERGEHLLRRKELYEQRYPDTRYGAAQARGMRRFYAARIGRSDMAEEYAATHPPFAVDAAEKIGFSDRAIREAMQRASRIEPAVRDRIRGIHSIAANGRELHILGELERKDQRRVVALVESGGAAGVREAIKTLRLSPTRTQKDDADRDTYRNLCRAWDLATPSARERFVAEKVGRVVRAV